MKSVELVVNNEEKPIHQPPYDSQMEAAVLGMVMFQNSALERLSFLEKEHFYVPLHQRIFAACKQLIDDGQLVTPMILKSRFDADPDLPQPGYLASCVGIASNFTLAWPYAKRLQNLAYRRELLAACEAAKDAACNEGSELTGIANKLSESCERISAGGKRWEMRKGTVVTQEIIDDMNRNVKPFSSGIKLLDKAMGGGLMPRNLYAFAGRQKSGKTILAGTISANLAMSGVKHLFICAEMSDKQIHQRNLARTGKFYPSVFRENDDYKNSADFKEKLAESMRWNHDNILFVNAPALTFHELKNYVKQAVRNHGIKGFILDYWQLVGGQEKNKNTSEHLYEVAQWLAASTKQFDIFGITAVQLNQEGNTFGSEGIRKACDQLYAINRISDDNPRIWLKMMDSRHTAYMDVGCEAAPKLEINGFGPYIEEFA